MIYVLCIICLITGFVLGVLFGRRNTKKVEAALAEAKKVYAEVKTKAKE